MDEPEDTAEPKNDFWRKYILRSIAEVIPTLSMLVSMDQRVGAKTLYGNTAFVDAVRLYYVASINYQKTQGDLIDQESLLESAQRFIDVIESFYPQHRRGLLTPLRRDYGRSLTELFKNTLQIRKLIVSDAMRGAAIEPEIAPIDLPDQRSSPIYTKIENDRIVLDAGHRLHPFLRKEAISQTRSYLREEFSELEQKLKDSNVDKRYVDAFSRLKGLLEFKDDSEAIAFGLHVRLVSNLTTKLENEIADVLSVHLAATLTHASYFASQYKDWVEFVQNAQSYPSREAIDGHIEDALTQVEGTLIENADSVDEKIPQSLRFIRSVLSGTAEDRKQAIYAAVTGVENVCIAAITYAFDQAMKLVQDAATAARPKLVKIGSAVIIVVALSIITNFMPVIKNASELSWILENLPKIEKLSRFLNK